MSPLRGTVRVPADKSLAHRACLLGALGEGQTQVRGFSGGGDNRSTLRCLRALGVRIDERADEAGRAELRIEGRGLGGLRVPESALDCGNSGTTMRLLAGILAGCGEGSFTLTGDASLSRRPMGRVARPLRALGAQIDLAPGDRPPMRIVGQALRGARWAEPVASAQVKSALLLAALAAEGETSFSEAGPSRDHTERMLERLGAPLRLDAPTRTLSMRGPVRLPAADWGVPGDPSSAAFIVAAALLVPGSEVEVRGVCLNPRRTGFLRALSAMGADVQVEIEETSGGEPVGRILARHGPLRGLTLDPAEVPTLIDELPVLALLCAFAEGESRLTGAAELAVKESDRIAATAELLRAAGADLEVLPDGWHLSGGLGSARGGFVAGCRNDHRIGLCAHLLGLRAQAPIALDAPECVAVSYPDFAAVLHGLRRPPTVHGARK